MLRPRERSAASSAPAGCLRLAPRRAASNPCWPARWPTPGRRNHCRAGRAVVADRVSKEREASGVSRIPLTPQPPLPPRGEGVKEGRGRVSCFLPGSPSPLGGRGGWGVRVHQSTNVNSFAPSSTWAYCSQRLRLAFTAPARGVVRRRQELQPQRHFPVAGRPAIQPQIASWIRAAPPSRCRPARATRARDSLDHEIAVEHEQLLQRHDGHGPFLAGQVGSGKSNSRSRPLRLCRLTAP